MSQRGARVGRLTVCSIRYATQSDVSNYIEISFNSLALLLTWTWTVHIHRNIIPLYSSITCICDIVVVLIFFHWRAPIRHNFLCSIYICVYGRQLSHPQLSFNDAIPVFVSTELCIKSFFPYLMFVRLNGLFVKHLTCSNALGCTPH